VQGSTSDGTSERDWLVKLIAACQRALEDLRRKSTPENQELEQDLERFMAELEERLRAWQSDAA
jgi:hypothetical protein